MIFAQEIVQTTQDLRIQQLEIDTEMRAQHGTWVIFSQKNAEIWKKNHMQTDGSFFPELVILVVKRNAALSTSNNFIHVRIFSFSCHSVS